MSGFLMGVGIVALTAVGCGLLFLAWALIGEALRGHGLKRIHDPEGWARILAGQSALTGARRILFLRRSGLYWLSFKSLR